MMPNIDLRNVILIVFTDVACVGLQAAGKQTRSTKPHEIARKQMLCFELLRVMDRFTPAYFSNNFLAKQLLQRIPSIKSAERSDTSLSFDSSHCL